MEKKRAIIIGSCVTRNLFNNRIMQNIFDIDLYVCQICSFALFDKGLGIESQLIKNANLPEFSTRNIDYELNKNAIERVKSFGSEYVFLDFHNIYSDIFLASIDNFANSVITQSNSYLIYNSLAALNAVEELKDLRIKKIPFGQVEKQIIEEGLRKLAVFLSEHFEENKIIIHIPQRVDKYVDINDGIYRYSEKLLEEEKEYDRTVFYYSKKFADMLPKAKIFYNYNNKFAKVIDSNVEHKSNPESNHFSDYDNLCAAKNMLNMLGIPYEKYWNYEISPEQYDSIQLNNKCMREYMRSIKLFKGSLTLNNYFDKIANFKDVIVILSAKDEALAKLKYFRNKKSIDLKMKMNYRDSYIAILDAKRNFIYEKSDAQKIEYIYKFDQKSIYVASAGFLTGNLSKIIVNGDGKNLSSQKTGLNIVILNSETLDVVDIAYCNTHDDKDLIVESAYFKNCKIHI